MIHLQAFAGLTHHVTDLGNADAVTSTQQIRYWIIEQILQAWLYAALCPKSFMAA